MGFRHHVVMTDVTRRSLHGVAELVLAGPQYRRSGTIRLCVRPGGFGTVADPELRIEGGVLVAGAARLPLDGATPDGLGAALGIGVGAPQGVYRDGSAVHPEERLSIDPAVAALIIEGFARGDAALRRLAPDQEPVLWPEHFDLGISVDEVNYGVSPGDSYLDEPYAYVGPWRRRDGEFWNVPFGAARPLRELSSAEALLAFLRAGQDHARRDPFAGPTDG
jgi:hypothetical protein